MSNNTRAFLDMLQKEVHNELKSNSSYEYSSAYRTGALTIHSLTKF